LQCEAKAGVASRSCASEPFGPVVAPEGDGGLRMNKVATVSWWSVAVLIAIVVLALVLVGR
jgi:hypothetical protein